MLRVYDIIYKYFINNPQKSLFADYLKSNEKEN